MKVKLLVHNGELTGKVLYILEGQSITIGRTFQNQIALSDPGCSRQHTRLNNNGDVCTVEDLKSRNGTFLNGEVVRGVVPLKSGDWIRVGGTLLRITTGIDTQAMQAEPPTTMPFEAASRHAPPDETAPEGPTVETAPAPAAPATLPAPPAAAPAPALAPGSAPVQRRRPTRSSQPPSRPAAAISRCAACGTPIPDDDLSAARARIVDGRPRCARCVGVEAGQHIGQYRLLERIAEGSTGKVFKAEHTTMGKVVALKVLHSKLTAKPNAVVRFLREARAGAAINHPNVIEMFDAGEDHGIYYLVMELVDGPSVAERVAQAGPLPLSLALKVMIQVAGALEYAHQKKIIHRDLRPANILLARDGTAKLIDLGTAKWLESSGMGTLTQSGSLVKDFNFAAPEQIMNPGLIDHRVDLYALGASTYFMLAGRPPFAAKTFTELVNGLRAGTAPPLRELNPKVPDVLAFMVDKLLAREPAGRPANAAEVMEEMKAVYSRLFGSAVFTGPADNVGEMLTPDARALQHDMRMAKDVQQKLLPDELPEVPRLDLAKYYKPCTAVGGDYFDVFPVAGGRYAFLIGDVSGKGISGAMVMVMVRSVFHMLDATRVTPKTALEEANRVICKDIRRGMFVSLIYMLYDPVDASLSIGNAGHNPPVLWRRRTRAAEFLHVKGMALGVTSGEKFAQTTEEARLPLEPGDRILLYTDGIVEALDIQKRQFGEAALLGEVGRTAEAEPGQMIQGVLQKVEAFRGVAPQSDDITLIALGCRG